MTEELKFYKNDNGRRIENLRGYAKVAGRSPDSIELSGNSLPLHRKISHRIDSDWRIECQRGIAAP